MEVTFINVGYGDAILVESNGFTLLLDGGSALTGEFKDFPFRIPAAEYIKQTGLSKIDLMILSHIHEDHIGGLEAIFDQVSVGEIRLPYDPALFLKGTTLAAARSVPPSVHLFTSALLATIRILELAKHQAIPVKVLQNGDRILLSSGIELDVLAPSFETKQSFENLLTEALTAEDSTKALLDLDRTANESSLLLKVSAENTALLLSADHCPDKWSPEFFSALQNVNVLKLPHHGQKDSISEEVFSKMPLTHVITTASSDRRYHSANPEVYNTLLRLHPNVTLLFTDERDYPPYFQNPDGARAIKLVIDSRGIHTEFIR
ncbi:ComEC/Rec2 family competence protein [Anoxybacterium hadale]|uniref:ComEC/Rec2 family competence protein n=1 Tax=Anoxybacterium hadale TaxID=3408580 RepID=UPI003B00C3F4